MQIPHSLADDLQSLTEAIGDPVLDLASVLTVLTDDLSTAVPSYLGLSLTLNLGELPLTLNSFADPTDGSAQSSMWLPLVPTDLAGPSGHVVLYARTAGAFNDLADDASWMLGHQGQAVVDSHIFPVTAGPSGLHGFREFCAINQAAGILIAMGETPDTALVELHRRAAATNRTILESAQDLLSASTAPSGGDER